MSDNQPGSISRRQFLQISAVSLSSAPEALTETVLEAAPAPTTAAPTTAAKYILTRLSQHGVNMLGDSLLIPQRGHLVILRKTLPKQFYFFSGRCANRVTSYVFCRQEDIVVGGTMQAFEESAAPGETDALTFQRLLANARALFDGRPAACVP